MPIVSVIPDPEKLTLTATGEYSVPVERLWAAWADPRKLERFWGPPQWPATFTRHDMTVGGLSQYHMNGPNGETSRGYWRFLRIDAPRSFEVADGFANDDGTPNDAFPESRMEMRFEPTPTGSRFVGISTFSSVEAMEKLLAMGMLEGLNAALSQMDEVLADLRAHAATFPAALTILDDTHVVITRDVRGSLAQVWRCHQEPALVQRWMLGPPGWTMPVCEVAKAVGDTYTFEWESEDGKTRFGFTGQLLEREAPRRERSTERMLGTDGPSTTNELVLTPRPGGYTRIEVRITYLSKEMRDMILGTGMVDGMETSYARLEAEVVPGV